MFYQLSNRNFYIVLCIDILLFAAALVGAFLVRFDFQLNSGDLEQIKNLLPVFIVVKAGIFFLMGTYKGMFRYAGVADMWRLVKAVFLSSLVLTTGFLFFHRFSGLSRGVFVLDMCLTLIFTGGFRMSLRLFFYEIHKRQISTETRYPEMAGKKPVEVFIIGAGDTGEKILREIFENPRLRYKIIGFLDDNQSKIKRYIHGVPVLGNIESMPELAQKYGVKDALIAAPSASGTEIRRIVRICEKSNVRFKTLPGLGELIDGKVSIKELRDVNYRDLLRRKPVELDVEGIEAYLKNKRVLVTGAGGSIGSELCRQIVRFQPEQLLLFDASEPNLYSIQMELKHRVGYLKYATILGQVQDSELVDRIMKHYNPHVIFHAAAYKHVPMLERNPWQAVRNNIRGCEVIMTGAIHYGAEYFVLVSTDKAVNPTNVMGASKRICEQLLNAYKGNGTRMMAVRFGNVVNSAGSVVPLFREQIARGGPVTVTHPEITRFFMTIPEAAQLILQAGALGKGGEMFILDMGTPIKIADMARDLIVLSGKEPDSEIKIVFTGLRDGEKLHEELMTAGEGVIATSHDKILRLKSKMAWGEKSSQQEYRKWLLVKVNELYELADSHDACGVRGKIGEIVEDYESKESVCVLS